MSNKNRPAMPSMPYGGDDCDRPACDDVKDAMAKTGLMNVADVGNKRQPNFVKKEVNCPVNTAQLGRCSWTLLHTMAAWYPDTPSSQDQSMMTNFIGALARFYPCSYCAADFQENLKAAPVKVKSREDLSMWLCEQHNFVNGKIGKPIFHCNMNALDERWRKSSNPQCRPT